MACYSTVTEHGPALETEPPKTLIHVNTQPEEPLISVASAGWRGAMAQLPSGTDVADQAHDALAFLAQRYSVGPKYLKLPAPSLEELRQAVSVALRAPDHQHLRPLRFVRVGDGQRERLGGLFARDAARRGHSAAEVQRARERAHNGPALLAVVSHVRPNVEDVPDHEQWVCIGAGLMNFLNALHLMGYGAKVLSGASVRDADIQAAFCRTGETLVAWVLAGTPTRLAHPKHEDDLQIALSDWAGASLVEAAITSSDA